MVIHEPTESEIMAYAIKEIFIPYKARATIQEDPLSFAGFWL